MEELSKKIEKLSKEKNCDDEGKGGPKQENYIVMQIKNLFNFTSTQKSKFTYKDDFYSTLIRNNMFGEFTEIVEKYQRQEEMQTSSPQNLSFDFKLYTVFNDLL